MSLNKRERAATADELRANLELSRLTEAELQSRLGLSDDRVILDRGGTPRPYSVLTPAARVSAEKWFALYDIDDVVKDISG